MSLLNLSRLLWQFKFCGCRHTQNTIRLDARRRSGSKLAKAFSETSSEDDAKKLYIKLRVEQLDAGEPQAQPEVRETPSSSTTPPDNTPPVSNIQDTPPSGSNAKPKFDLKNMSWPDRIAWLVACCATGGFVGDVGTTLAMGMSVELYKVFTGQLILLYIGFPFAIWRLVSAGYFRGLLPGNFGSPFFKASDNLWKLKGVLFLFIFLPLLDFILKSIS